MADEGAEAARVEDQVKHSNAMMGVLLGVLAGAAIAVAVVATGGAAAIVIGAAICTGASLGGTVGQLIGKHIPGPDCGPIVKGINSILIEKMFVAVVTSPAACNGPPIGTAHPTSQIAQGSSSVFFGGFPAARKGDKMTCGAKIGSGASSVFIGGKKTTYLPISAEVPAWVDYSLLALGLLGGYGALLKLGYTTIGIMCRLGGGLIGGGLGSYGGSKLADYENLDEDSWARDGLVVGGGVIGGGAGFAAGNKAGLLHETPLWEKTANDFYASKNPWMSPDDILSHTSGIDFTKPVNVIDVPPGGLGSAKNELYQYTRVNSEGTELRGDYYTDNPNATPSQLGVSEKYQVTDASRAYTQEIKSRIQQKVTIDEPVQGLKSTAKSIDDVWSFENETIPTTGKGSQIYIPKSR